MSNKIPEIGNSYVKQGTVTVVLNDQDKARDLLDAERYDDLANYALRLAIQDAHKPKDWAAVASVANSLSVVKSARELHNQAFEAYKESLE